MQDALLKVWERWERVRDLDDPTGYLYRTALEPVPEACSPRSRRIKYAIGPSAEARRARRGRVARHRATSARGHHAAATHGSRADRSARLLLRGRGSTDGRQAATVRVLASQGRATLRNTWEVRAVNDTRRLLRETRDRVVPPSDVLGALDRRRWRDTQVGGQPRRRSGSSWRSRGSADGSRRGSVQIRPPTGRGARYLRPYRRLDSTRTPLGRRRGAVDSASSGISRAPVHDSRSAPRWVVDDGTDLLIRRSFQAGA